MSYSLRSAIKGSAIYTIGQFLTRAIGFILIPIYTRFLTPDDYGIIGIINVVIVMMTAVLSLGAYQAQTRLYYDFHNDRKKIGELLFSINTMLFCTAFTACLILTLFGKPIFQYFIKSQEIDFNSFVIIAIWTIFFNIINRLIPNYYVATKQYTYCASLWIVQFILSACAIIIFVVVLREGALGSIKGVFVGQVLFFILFYRSYAKNFIWRLNKQYVKDILALGLPIVLHTTASAVMVSIDRLILQKYVNLSDVGLYTVGYKFGIILSIVVVSVNKAWMPNYYELMNQPGPVKSREIKRSFCIWMTVIGSICILGSAWTENMIMLLTTEAYYSASVVVPMILLGYLFQGIYIFMSGPLFYFKKVLLIPILTGTAALINVGLNILLIPQIGIMGAALATTLSFAFLAVTTYLLSRKFFDPHYELFRLLLLILMVSMISLSNVVYDLNWILKIILSPCYLLACYLLFPEYLKPLIKKVF